MLNKEKDQIFPIVNKGKRKVFLLNTHLDNLLNAPEIFFKKLDSIISYFEKNDQIVLLWRPHPLSIETIMSMQISIITKYLKVIEKFKKMSNCIYDDSSDLHRAIAISDAYIGDLSSLVGLYGTTGKPMLIIEPLNEGVACGTISFVAGALSGDWLYFSACYFNGFFKLNIVTNELVHLGIFYKELKSSNFLHRVAYCNEGDCWFIPWKGEFIIKVNLHTLEMEYMTINKECIIVEEQCKFIDALKKDRYLWLIPAYVNGIVRVDLKTGEQKCYKGWPEEAKLNFGKSNFKNAVFAENNLILLTRSGEYIILLDTLLGKMRLLEFNYPDEAYWAVTYDGKCLWFAPHKSNVIIKWNLQSGKKTMIDIPNEIISNKGNFSNIFFLNEYIWMIPHHASGVLKINPKSDKVYILKGYNEHVGFIFDNRIIGDFIGKVSSDDKLILTSVYADALPDINLSSDEIVYYNLISTDFRMIEYIVELRENGIPCAEKESMQYIDYERFISIKLFIEDVCLGKNRWANERIEQSKTFLANCNGTCGNEIWSNISNQLKRCWEKM